MRAVQAAGADSPITGWSIQAVVDPRTLKSELSNQVSKSKNREGKLRDFVPFNGGVNFEDQALTTATGSLQNSCVDALIPTIPGAVSELVRADIDKSIGLVNSVDPTQNSILSMLRDVPVETVFEYSIDDSPNTAKQTLTLDDIELPKTSVLTESQLARELGVDEEQLYMNVSPSCSLTSQAAKDLVDLSNRQPNSNNQVQENVR